jgi:CheY-like chemotaxis protein
MQASTLSPNLQAVHVQGSGHRILIVEDSPVVRLYLKHALESMQPPCQVDVAANGLEGLNAMEQGAYDVIFCDLDLPLLGGRDFCSIVRGRAQRQRIVIFTSDYQSRHEPQFLNDPSTVFLQKPASRLEIWSLVGQLLAA